MIKVMIRIDDDTDREMNALSVAELISLLSEVEDKTVPVTFDQGAHYPVIGGVEIQVIDDEGNETDEVEQFQLYGW